MSYGQEVTDLIYSFTEGNQDKDINIDELIEEFKKIMLIDKEDRSVEQWDRAIEILFLIYFNADVKALVTELEKEIENYDKLISETENLLLELEEVYAKEKELLLQLETIRNDLKILYDDYYSIDDTKRLNINIFGGYTINTGLNLGFGVGWNITDNFIIGGLFGITSNFQDINLFNINIYLGFKF